MPRTNPTKERASSYKTLTIGRKLEILHEANLSDVSDRSVAVKHEIFITSIRD